MKRHIKYFLVWTGVTFLATASLLARQNSYYATARVGFSDIPVSYNLDSLVNRSEDLQMIKVNSSRHFATRLFGTGKGNSGVYYISKYEVSVAEFAAFVKATGYLTNVEQLGTNLLFDPNPRLRKPRPTRPGVNWRHNEHGSLLPPSEFNRPVVHISWNDAMAYCKWLSSKTGHTFRLPTEAEWEYAARDKRKRVSGYSWGEALPQENYVGNVRDLNFISEHPQSKAHSSGEYQDGHVYAAPVGSYDPNRRGIHDLTGNVWEWCLDLYSDTDTTIYSPYRSIRGGSWNTSPEYSSITTRGNCRQNSSSFDIGFRIVMIPNKKKYED